jgi:hypothetical protein
MIVHLWVRIQTQLARGEKGKQVLNREGEGAAFLLKKINLQQKHYTAVIIPDKTFRG